MEKETTVQLNNGRKLKFTFPDQGISQEAEIEFSKAYTKALKSGLLPRVAMDKLVIENGLWTDEDEKKITDATTNMQNILLKLKTEITQEESDKLKLDFRKYQSDYIASSIKKETLYSNTAESKGEEAKNIDLFLKCTFNAEDGSRVWKTQKDFFNDRDNTGWIAEAGQRFITFIRGLEEKINSIESLFDDKEIKKTDVVAKETEVEVKTEEVKV